MSTPENQTAPPAPELLMNFAVPLLRLFVPNAEALNRDLKAILLAKEKEMPANTFGKTRSNMGGWRSNKDVLHWDEPAIKTLQNEIVKAVKLMMHNGSTFKDRAKFGGLNMVSFANIHRNGSYNVTHAHAQVHWAVVYYVETGRPEPGYPNNGHIAFQDSRVAATGLDTPGFTFNQEFSIEPKPGMMLVFPGWLYHSVYPFFGEGERMSIATNVKLLP